MEQLNYNLLYRPLVCRTGGRRAGVGAEVFTKNRERLFRAKDGSDEPPSGGRSGERDFHGETRSNDTHTSTTDPEAKLYRKGKGKMGIPRKSAGDSERSRPPIPIETGQGFR
jgi:hypothetical protein